MKRKISRGGFTLTRYRSSSLDKTTDKHMQTFIREAFADALIITIAHRLDTIIDYVSVPGITMMCLTISGPDSGLGPGLDSRM